MDLRNITNPSYRLVLVQYTLSEAQQEAVAHILESDIPASKAYPQLKAELTPMHQKSSWYWLGELFALPPCCGQMSTELLAAMERLKTNEADLWFRWQYFSCRTDWIQHQLAEDTSLVRELAKRVNELQWKAPAVAMVPAPTPLVAEIATVGQTQPAKKQWNKGKPDYRKHRHSGDVGHSSQGGAKRDLHPWVSMGICKFHYRFGDGATSCYKPCLRVGN